MIRILITCKTGLTTNLLVEEMGKVAKRSNHDIIVYAVAETQIKSELGNFDIVLVGPQVSAIKVKEVVGEKYPVQQIAKGDYTSLDAERIINEAINAYKTFSKANRMSVELSILIACTAGVSSELIVTDMNKVIKEKELNFHIKAIPETQIENEIHDFDVLLLGPQVSITKVKEVVGDRIPVEAIKTSSYTTLNGEAILNQAANLYNSK